MDTCAHELINAVTLCPLSITGASFDHPTRHVTGSGFKNGMTGVATDRSVCLAAFMLAGLQGQGGNVRGLLLAGAAVTNGGEPHSLSSPRLV